MKKRQLVKKRQLAQESAEQEGEYDEDAGEENYEDYAEEEYHQDDLHNEDNEELATGDEETGEFLEANNDGSYAADQFDQASSKTVSASNEPVDKNDDLLDNLQTGTKTDANEGLDYTQDIPDLPDLPDDDLLDLDDDIFADTGNPLTARQKMAMAMMSPFSKRLSSMTTSRMFNSSVKEAQLEKGPVPMKRRKLTLTECRVPVRSEPGLRRLGVINVL